MSEVVTGDAVVVEVRVAQFGSRAVAIVIDMFLLFLVMFAVNTLLGAFAAISDFAMFMAVTIVMDALIMVGYPVMFETFTRGRSLGKLALGLRVVGDDGSPVRFRQSLFRGLAGVLELWGTFGAGALIASLASKRGKRIGDVFAGTIVISDRAPRDRRVAIMMPPQLAAWASTLELSQLPDQVMDAARQYLMRWHDLSPQVRHEMGVRIATQAASFVSPAAPPGVPAHAYLSAILAERGRREEERFAKRMGNGLPQPGPYAPQPGPQPPPPINPQPLPYSQQGPYGPPPGPAPAPEPPQATPGGFAPPQ
ncbi:RDD family protein [Nonomuraea sp. NPDC050404]|uniref:RDD family protein n=1 Tax=Nonomuraea sp. NPDC050404 TaxID=3155783 RepID=UPI003400EDE3